MHHWIITNHACRVCLGRVLVRECEDGSKRTRCAECGTESAGGPKSVCACGKKHPGGRDAGLRCILNTDQRPELPQEIVVISVPPSQRRREKRLTDCAKDGLPVLPEVVTK